MSHLKVEARHIRDIEAAGKDLQSLDLEGQLASWESRHGTQLTPGDVQDVQRLAAAAASSYELVENLGIYDAALANVATMQRMSHDRQRFDPVDFVVATDLAGLGDPRVSYWLPVHNTDFQADDYEPVVWIPLNSVQQLGAAAQAFTRRLVMVAGSVGELSEALATRLSWRDVLSILRRGRLPHEQTLPYGSSDHPRTKLVVYPQGITPPDDAQSLVEVAWMTFMIGHEAGHIYQRHWPQEKLMSVVRTSLPVAQDWLAEAAADTVGIAAVWDGMSARQSRAIDDTWIGPLLCLAYHAGRDAARAPEDLRALPSVDAWLFRLQVSVVAIARSLRANGFEAYRAARILCGAAPLAAGFYEFIRSGGDDPHSASTLGPPGSMVYAMLEELVLSEIATWT